MFSSVNVCLCFYLFVCYAMFCVSFFDAFCNVVMFYLILFVIELLLPGVCVLVCVCLVLMSILIMWCFFVICQCSFVCFVCFSI